MKISEIHSCDFTLERQTIWQMDSLLEGQHQNRFDQSSADRVRGFNFLYVFYYGPRSSGKSVQVALAFCVRRTLASTWNKIDNKKDFWYLDHFFIFKKSKIQIYMKLMITENQLVVALIWNSAPNVTNLSPFCVSHHESTESR